MAMRATTPVGILLGLLVLFAAPARGQVASYVDGHGKRVFINANTPARQRNSGLQANSGPALHRPGIDQMGLSLFGAPQSTGMPWRLPKVPKEGLEKMVHETAQRHRVDPALVRAVIEAESNWNPSAISRRGALGLMQLVPGIAVRYGVGNAFNPQQNLEAGVKYLRALLERYNGDLEKSLAAYNAGEGAVDRARGVPRFPETRYYVKRVTESYFRSGPGWYTKGWVSSRPIYRATDQRGRVIFTNE